jgi:hypothetical protein
MNSHGTKYDLTAASFGDAGDNRSLFEAPRPLTNRLHPMQMSSRLTQNHRKYPLTGLFLPGTPKRVEIDLTH